MQISFTTKNESKKKQEEAFLALSGDERMEEFFKLMELMKTFPSSVEYDTKDNFIIDFTARNE